MRARSGCPIIDLLAVRMRGFQCPVRGHLQLIISFPDPNPHAINAHAHHKEGVSHAEKHC